MRTWKPHSYEKLSILTDYLEVFAKASSSAANRVYLDAFAGETLNRIAGTDRTFPGSAETALEVKPPFTHIRLFELSRKRVGELSGLVAGRPNARVVQGDCNVTIPTALASLPVQAPTFAFLDPDGLQVEWATVKAIADHKRKYAESAGKYKVEMWILFSTSGMVRMLGKNREAVGENRLLDEPSLGLAPLYIKKIFQIVRELNAAHGMTILLVELNANHALKVAHRAYVMQHGQIVLSGSGAELLASPEVRAAYLEGGH